MAIQAHDLQTNVLEVPCEPTNILAILKLLEMNEPSMQHVVPFFEKDLVLTLKVISLANQMMKGRSSRAIAVRSVPHALSILGFDSVYTLIQQCKVCDTSDQSLYFQVYRFTLARAQLLLTLCQAFSVFHPALNQDDIRLYVSVLTLGELIVGREKPPASHALYYLYQREPIDFWFAQTTLFGTTFCDLSLKLTQSYDLPRDTQLALEAWPDLGQFSQQDARLNVGEIHSFLKQKYRDQNRVLPIIVLSYCLVHRSPTLYADKTTWFLVHWIARFLHRSPHEIWRKIQVVFQKTMQSYPLLETIGRALLSPGLGESPVLEVRSIIAQYRKLCEGSSCNAAIDITQARSLPEVAPLDTAVSISLPESTPQLKKEQVNQKQPSAPRPSKIAKERQPDESLQRFITSITQSPRMYGKKLPTASAMLETLRIGLGASFCLAIFFDSAKKRFWVGSVSGLASAHPIRQWTLTEAGAGLLRNFLIKPVGVYLTDQNRAQITKALPQTLVAAIGKCEAMMCSSTSGISPSGVIVAVSHPGECFSRACYASFQRAVFATSL